MCYYLPEKSLNLAGKYIKSWRCNLLLQRASNNGLRIVLAQMKHFFVYSKKKEKKKDRRKDIDDAVERSKTYNKSRHTT